MPSLQRARHTWWANLPCTLLTLYLARIVQMTHFRRLGDYQMEEWSEDYLTIIYDVQDYGFLFQIKIPLCRRLNQTFIELADSIANV